MREIEFDAVSFEYRPGQPVISDFSLRVPGGSVVALVGASGAGKTTLTDLLARFRDPTAGSLRVNGIALPELQLRSYRSLIGIVAQELFLFDGTVADNIAYGAPSASRDEIRRSHRGAARLSATASCLARASLIRQATDSERSPFADSRTPGAPFGSDPTTARD